MEEGSEITYHTVINYAGPAVGFPFSSTNLLNSPGARAAPLNSIAFEIVHSSQVLRRGVFLTPVHHKIIQESEQGQRRNASAALDNHRDGEAVDRSAGIQGGSEVCVWYYHRSATRHQGESQDLRTMYDDLPQHTLAHCSLQPLSLTPESFLNWIRQCIPKPVRDLALCAPLKRRRAPTSTSCTTVPSTGISSGAAQDNSLTTVSRRRCPLASSKSTTTPLPVDIPCIQTLTSGSIQASKSSVDVPLRDPSLASHSVLSRDNEDPPLDVRLAFVEDELEYLKTFVHRLQNAFSSIGR